MSGMDLTPRRTLVAENIRDLQGCHARRSGGWQRQLFQWTGHFTEHAGRHVAIAGRGIQLAVSKQYLDDADIDFILQQMGGKAVPFMPSSA